MKYTVLGAGIAGLSAAYHLGQRGHEATVAEKNASWGGLCDNFAVDGFRFDHAVHLSFTEDEYVKRLFADSADFYTYQPEPFSYYTGRWLKHPAQNNLFPLDVSEKVKIIKSLVERSKGPAHAAMDYEQWLRIQYGDAFTEQFPLPYTRKYWTTEANMLTTDWLGDKMYRPSLEEVLHGAMTDDTPHTYYAHQMRYPKLGGFKAFLSKMAADCDIRLNKRAALIDTGKKCVEYEDGSEERYERLISTIPLPELVRIIKDAPRNLIEAAARLHHSSVTLVSLGFDSVEVAKHLWFYIYDEDILPARAYSPNLKSADNVPAGCSSLQFEIYSSAIRPLPFDRTSAAEQVMPSLLRLGLFKEADLKVADSRTVEYANVIFDNDRQYSLRCIRSFLHDKGVVSAGRFGEWDYFWSDQSLLSGKRAAEQ